MSELELYRLGPRQRLTLARRLLETVRSYTLGPWSTKDRALAGMIGRSTSAGVSVNEDTAKRYSAVWAAVNMISSGVSTVPLSLYKILPDGKGKEEFKNHSTYRLLHDQANPQMGSMVFWRTLQAHALVWGNGYAEIVRDSAGRPREMWPLRPYAVQPFIGNGRRLEYRIYNPNGSELIFPAEDIIHLRGMGDDGVQGYSVIGNASDSIGLGIAAERFGATFFGNGSTFGGIIKYPAGVSTTPQARKDNAEALNRKHQGVDKAHQLLAIYEGADYIACGVPPNAAQFLETRQFQIEEVCRWFNIAPHKLHHLLGSSYNSLEHQAIEYDTDTLNPWWVLWEQELQMKLVPSLEQSQQRVEHKRQGRLQADVASRGTFYQSQFNVGSISPNEIRDLENRNPAAGGDQLFVMNNLIPIELATEYWQAEIEAKKRKAEPPSAPVAPVDPEPERQEQLLLARKAMQLAEDRADMATEAGRSAVAAAVAQREALSTELMAARDMFAGQLDVAEALRVATAKERDEWREAYGAMQTKHDTAQSIADRLVVELSDEKLARAAERDALGDKVRVLEGAQTQAGSEAETLKTDLARARADLATELDSRRAQTTVMLAAMRSLFVDASERVLQREMDRARKHQATPEKLRAWVETFYPLHAETCRQAFRPLVGPWTAVVGGAPGVLLERMVSEHLTESTTALRLVAEQDDPDQLAAELERTLRRWEQERSDAMADALMREGMTNG